MRWTGAPGEASEAFLGVSRRVLSGQDFYFLGWFASKGSSSEWKSPAGGHVGRGAGSGPGGRDPVGTSGEPLRHICGLLPASQPPEQASTQRASPAST